MFSLSLPQHDSAITQLMRDVKTGLDKLDPILGQIQSVPVAHGGTTRQVSEPKIVDTAMKRVSVEVTIELDWYRQTDTKKFVEFLCGMCQSFQSRAKKDLFEMVSLTTEAVGNSFPLEGRNFWDAQIEIMKRTEMRFDQDGKHHYQFYLHPDTAKKLAASPPTPEQEKLWQETINAKREEYYAKKRIRRLS